MEQDRKICVGQIAGAHGVRGLVRLRSFTEDPASIAGYKPLTDEDGKTIAVTIKSPAKEFFIASIKGVENKEDADALRGTKLFVARSTLPKIKKTEYYEADLIGLDAQDKSGHSLGTVRAVHNYGAGPLLEIGKGKGNTFMLPFNDVFVPRVDIKAGQVVIDPPEGWVD